MASPFDKTAAPAFDTTARERELIPAVRAALQTASTDASVAAADAAYSTDATVTRYLRARSHDPVAAAAMLARTLVFRRERASDLSSVCEHCVRDARSHSFIPIGPGACGPVVYSNFAVANRSADAAVSHMLFALEALFDKRDTRRMVWLMDFHGFRAADVSPASARSVLGLFADHYPERLDRAVIYGAPPIFYALWRAVKLFAPPETVRKVVFVRHGRSEREQKLKEAGITGPTLDRLCREIDDVRTPAGAEVNWWTKRPLDPLPHYGERIVQRAQESTA